MSAFDTFADGVNHLASAVLDVAIPILIAWAIHLAQRYLPSPAARAAESHPDSHPADQHHEQPHHQPRTPITHPQAQPAPRAERRP